VHSKNLTENLNIQIILYFSSKYLDSLLKSIRSLNDGGYSSIVFNFVDQSENEKEYEKVKNKIQKFSEFLPLKFNIKLTKQKNYGFGKGHNKIYQQNKHDYGDYFIIINPDSILHHDLLHKISRYLEFLKHSNWGMLELEQFPNEHPKFFNPYTLETNWVSCAGAIINSTAFDQIGMFDENIFMYGEDVDLSIRMRMNSYKILHLPEAKFTHLTKDTDVSEESTFTRVHKQAAELYLRYKFGENSDVDKYLKLIGPMDPNRTEIIEKYYKMKEKGIKRTPFSKFVNHKTQDYTNFRWSM